jgi:hypothetical protein
MRCLSLVVAKKRDQRRGCIRWELIIEFLSSWESCCVIIHMLEGCYKLIFFSSLNDVAAGKFFFVVVL